MGIKSVSLGGNAGRSATRIDDPNTGTVVGGETCALLEQSSVERVREEFIEKCRRVSTRLSRFCSLQVGMWRELVSGYQSMSPCTYVCMYVCMYVCVQYVGASFGESPIFACTCTCSDGRKQSSTGPRNQQGQPNTHD
jgi:hypothetical protein